MLFVGLFAVAQPAHATGQSVSVEVDGFAWSSTIGWISMSCTNPIPSFPNGTCSNQGGFDYGVRITPSGEMSGYAWSPNVGWINFNPVGPFPAGSATTDDSARSIGTYPNLVLTGWARVCSVYQFGCSGNVKSASELGGWDGWISLGGTGYDIVFTNGEADDDSYAWGGPLVVGWIDFAPNATGVNPVGLNLRTDIIINAMSASEGVMNALGYYDSVTFLVDVDGIPVGTTNVPYRFAYAGIAPISITGLMSQTVTGPVFVPPLTFTNVPFTASTLANIDIDLPEPGVVAEDDFATPQNEDIEGNTLSQNFNLTIPEPIITITGPTAVRAGERASVDWEVTALYPLTCTVRGPGIPGNTTISVNGAIGTPDTNSGSGTSTPMTNAGRFTISCDYQGQTYSEFYQAEVIPAVQEV